MTDDLTALRTMKFTATIAVGDLVELNTPNGLRKGHVLSIQDSPRKLTGGRGVGLRLDDGTYTDGWDLDEVRLLIPGMPRKLWDGLIADLAQDCGRSRNMTAEALRTDLDDRCEAAMDNADRWTWLDAMRRSLLALMAVPVID